MCQYAFYEENSKTPRLYCKLTDKICLYSKFCDKRNKYIHREGAETCYMAMQQSKETTPSGAYHVRFVLKGYAYVELNDNRVIKVKDTIGNIKNFVYLREINGEYEMSLTPFEEVIEEKKEKKRQYNRKKK